MHDYYFRKAFETDLITQARVHCSWKICIILMHLSMNVFCKMIPCMHELREIRNLEWFSQMPLLFRANLREHVLVISKNQNSKIESVRDSHWDWFIQMEQKFKILSLSNWDADNRCPQLICFLRMFRYHRTVVLDP